MNQSFIVDVMYPLTNVICFVMVNIANLFISLFDLKEFNYYYLVYICGLVKGIYSYH